MDYFLIAPEGWGISEQQFTRIITTRWPATIFKKVANPGDAHTHSLEFQLPMEESTLYGALNRDGSAIIYFGDLRDCAKFALWYQSVVSPEALPLLLCDESYNRSIELQAGTTVEEILHAFSYEPPQ